QRHQNGNGGAWFIGIAEWDALMKAAASKTKSFLTQRFDRFRPPYGRHLIKRLRQCVFAATINPPAEGYLKDPSGARRFWPVACPGTLTARVSNGIGTNFGLRRCINSRRRAKVDCEAIRIASDHRCGVSTLA